MNLGLENQVSKQMTETNGISLNSRSQPVLNIIYNNPKALDSVTNNEVNNQIFTSQLDTFDMSQIALQVEGKINFLDDLLYKFKLFKFNSLK